MLTRLSPRPWHTRRLGSLRSAQWGQDQTPGGAQTLPTRSRAVLNILRKNLGLPGVVASRPTAHPTRRARRREEGGFPTQSGLFLDTLVHRVHREEGGEGSVNKLLASFKFQKNNIWVLSQVQQMHPINCGFFFLV